MESNAKTTKVYKVPIEKTVENGLHAFLQRSFSEAEADNAQAIILEIHTNGGFVDAAGEIAQLIDSADPDIEIIAYINDKALSAGAFLALHADKSICRPMDVSVRQQLSMLLEMRRTKKQKALGRQL